MRILCRYLWRCNDFLGRLPSNGGSGQASGCNDVEGCVCWRRGSRRLGHACGSGKQSGLDFPRPGCLRLTYPIPRVTSTFRILANWKRQSLAPPRVKYTLASPPRRPTIHRTCRRRNITHVIVWDQGEIRSPLSLGLVAGRSVGWALSSLNAGPIGGSSRVENVLGIRIQTGIPLALAE